MERIINIETKEIHEIETIGAGKEKKSICPNCSKDRKKKTQKVLSYNSEKETAFCHHCNASFVKYKNIRNNDKTYLKPPKWTNNTQLDNKVVKYFEGRKISQNTLKKANITSGAEWMPQFGKEVQTIQFNYFLDSELINVKYRGPEKSFKLYKDAELIFYNLDSIKNVNECIIVEGEIDALSFIEVGYNNVVSVPAGANAKNTSYIDNYLDYFVDKKTIYLATDNDIKGIELRNELARRFGKSRCKKVEFGEFKDANELHVKRGAETLRNCVENAKDYPIEGLFNITDFESAYYNLFNNGLQRGYVIDNEIDDYISFQKGRLYTITGIPNHGKSNWLDFVIARLSIMHKLKFAYFSPENHPLELHMATISEKLIGSPFDKSKTPQSKIDMAYDYMKDNFWFIAPPKDFSIDSILDTARSAIEKNGVNGIVIDPYNKIEHHFDNKTTETNYISQLLDKLTSFAIDNDIILFLVAHPKKMAKINGIHELPSLYDINGSANFYNKTDFGITVYRNFVTGQSEIHIQKAKFKHLGTVGMAIQDYNINNGRYSDTTDGMTSNFDNSNWLQGQTVSTELDFGDIDDLQPNEIF